MKNPLTWLIVACVVIGLLAALSIQQSCQRSNYKKSAEDYKLKYEACMSAPFTYDTTRDSIVVNGRVWLKPHELSKLEITIDTSHLVYRIKWDTVFIDTTLPKFCEKYFADNYKVIEGKDTGIIYYAVRSKDCQTQVIFPRVTLPKQIITITDHIDTCITKPPEYYPVNHYGIGIHVMGNSIYKMPNFDAEFFYTIRDRFDVSAGGEVNAYHGEVYAKIGGRIYLDHLKKKK